MTESNGVNGTANGTNGVNGHSDAPVLPQPHLTSISPDLALLEPLSRLGHGPGLILLVPATVAHEDNVAIKEGVPSVMMKWAEEGYAVVQIHDQLLHDGAGAALNTALEALARCPSCDQSDKIGLVAYDAHTWNTAAPALASVPKIVAACIYAEASTSSSLSSSTIPAVRHLAGKSSEKLPRSSSLTAYDYPSVKSSLFATPFSAQFNYAAEAVSHTRNLTLLKREMGGPHFDLEAIWDEHTYYEFEVRDVPKTMATMVQEPYVNHIPTMTGGIGRTRLTDFYANHFVFQNPADTELELISRTVGIDRVVDEFLYKFTHDAVIDWLCPGIPPTGKYVELPFTAVVNIRGDRLYHEHIAWDQAGLLRQLGILPDSLPLPAWLADGATGKALKLPVAGKEAAEKMRDKNAVESNELFQCGIVDGGS